MELVFESRSWREFLFWFASDSAIVRTMHHLRTPDPRRRESW
jgi:hypothetical protein